jgi:hypothetical protein
MKVLAITFFIFSVGGNCLVILAYLSDLKVKSSLSNLYLVCLAWVDLLMEFLSGVIPWGFVYQYNQGR